LFEKEVFMRNKNFLEAIAIMVGCIVGGGILALPYAVSRSGFWSSILLIVGLGVIMIFLHLMVGEMNFAVKSSHEVVGLVEIFLGKFGKYLMTLAMLLLSYGAITAYIIGSSKILSLLGGNTFIWKLIFLSFGIFVVAKGINSIGGSELILELVKLLIIFLIVAFVFNVGFNPVFFTGFSMQGIGMVFGVSLFSYLGVVSVPLVYELVKEKKEFKKVIILGSIFPIIIYIFFVVSVISTTGKNTTEVATIGLNQFFPPVISFFVNVFAFLALITSFLAISYSVYIMFFNDFGFKRRNSLIFTFIPPIFGIFFFESFAGIINLTGSIAGSAMVILLILAHRNARKRFDLFSKVPFFVYLFLIAIFILGVVFSFI
jgi:tyrosine-specific transport protein